MSGSVWPSLVAGARAKASEVESKFDWIEGDLVPMNGGSKVDNTYDLGQSSFRFRTGYFGPGSVGSPAVSVRASDTGFYSSAIGALDFAIGGANVLAINNTGSNTMSQSLTSTMAFTVNNGRNDTTSAHAQILIRSNGAGAGDAFQTFNINGVTNWSQGIDNSDSDSYKISASATLGTTDMVVITTAGEMSKPFQPAFLAVPSVDADNVTGGGTTYTVVWGSEIFDQNSDFSTPSFTAPVTGRYHFMVKLNLEDMSTTSTIELNLVTTARTYTTRCNNCDTEHEIDLDVIADMTAGNTAQVTTRVQGAADTADIQGGTGPVRSFFSGILVA